MSLVLYFNFNTSLFTPLFFDGISFIGITRIVSHSNCAIVPTPRTNQPTRPHDGSFYEQQNTGQSVPRSTADLANGSAEIDATVERERGSTRETMIVLFSLCNSGWHPGTWNGEINSRQAHVQNFFNLSPLPSTSTRSTWNRQNQPPESVRQFYALPVTKTIHAQMPRFPLPPLSQNENGNEIVS